MKKEKYIREIKQGKCHYLRVEIKYNNGGKRSTYSKVFKISDYSSPKICMTAAIMERDKFLDKLQTGNKVNSKTLLSDVFEMSKELYPISAKTKERHNSFFRNAMQVFNGVYIEDITSVQIQSFLNEYAQNHSKDAIDRMMSLWKRLYKTAIMNDLDVRDQSIKLMKPKSKKVSVKKSVEISDADYHRFLDKLEMYNLSGGDRARWMNRTIYFVLEIMHYTGMRPAEVFALTRDDIHDDYISVSKSVGSTSSNKRQIVPTKTESSVREIPINLNLRPILDVLLNERKTHQLILDFNGKLLEIDYFSHYIHLVSKSSGIQFNSYMLRHKFSTEMLLNNVDLRTTQDLMGHTNAKMTVDYARSTNESRLDAISKLS